MIKTKSDLNIAIIGLGYVGLPLAIAFGKLRTVIGFDINERRIIELSAGTDKNLESTKSDIKEAKFIKFTSDEKQLNNANCYIITVPTPINKSKKPDLRPILTASKLVAKYLKINDIVIYESTVYPGCIEEDCVPILEKFSKLKFNKDFFCGYSPERINPGDKVNTISNIIKITSGSTPKIANLIDGLYGEIIKAGTYKVSSIKVAEAAKVIENTQRDLNIALINELSMFFQKMNIETNLVLDAANTKWNFLPFKPGLVGGHCIGVDPYYLTYKANKIGFKTKVISAGRKINDNMSKYAVSLFISMMKKKSIKIKNSRILIMGLTFKENCADIRNSGVQKINFLLKKYGCSTHLYDPWTISDDVKKVYGSSPISTPKKKYYDGVLIAVAHDVFKKIGYKSIISLCKNNNVIFDLKNIFKSKKIDIRL